MRGLITRTLAAVVVASGVGLGQPAVAAPEPHR